MTIKIPVAIPEKMHAISIGEDNSPASLSLTEHDTPRPDTHEILVKIGAAGVNRGDCYQRMGFYPPPPGASEIMGLEFAERSWPAGRASRAGSPARALPVWWPAVAMPNTGSCMKTTR